MRASTRWSTLVKARIAEMQRLDPGRSEMGPAFWNTRARRFAAATAGTAERDPLFARLRRATGPRSTVLDVGAGPGRFTLAIAPRVARVVAVDSSPVMVDMVARRARQLKLSNVQGVVGEWPHVDVAPAAVSVCSYVVPLIPDVRRFLQRIDDCTTERAFVYINAASLEFLTDPLWRHFHGTPRRLGPTYLDLVAVLAEIGITADVEIVELPTRARHKNLHAAVKAYRDQLLLPDEPAVRRELRSLLSAWLVEDKGQLRPPVRSTPAAIVSWRPAPD